MKVLVNTYVFLWSTTVQERLTPRLLSTMQDPRNAIWLSAVSVWEVRLRREKGKLEAVAPLDLLVDGFLGDTLNFLPVSRRHATAPSPDGLETLDPFDRMLLAQCACEDMRLLTIDRKLADYPLAIPSLAA